jgi:integrase/recombinase XerC
MRGEEISYLPVKAILALKPDPDRPAETQPLRIKITKGRKFRWIALPNSLLIELHEYIRGERANAVGKRLAKGRTDEGTLFVNMEDHPEAGAMLTTQSIHRLTHALVLRLGFWESATRTRDGVTETYRRTLHSFHDTRHSYAVNLYISQRSAGDPKPWETVQVMLGHKNWLTTENYYLRAVGIFEPAIGVTLNTYWEAE